MTLRVVPVNSRVCSDPSTVVVANRLKTCGDPVSSCLSLPSSCCNSATPMAGATALTMNTTAVPVRVQRRAKTEVTLEAVLRFVDRAASVGLDSSADAMALVYVRRIVEVLTTA